MYAKTSAPRPAQRAVRRAVARLEGHGAERYSQQTEYLGGQPAMDEGILPAIQARPMAPAEQAGIDSGAGGGSAGPEAMAKPLTDHQRSKGNPRHQHDAGDGNV